MQGAEQVNEDYRIGYINQDLPVSFVPNMKYYYVRDCYPLYYDKIIEILFGPGTKFEYVTVTGTPGIGKSMFYQYFFDRYKRENPKTTIITASFSTKQLLKYCYVFAPDEPRKGISSLAYKTPDKDYPGAIHLYDGPPNFAPSFAKMVAFTSPNAEWLDEIYNNVGIQAVLYMPVWKFAEMIKAANMLELPIEPDELYKRYYHFGGEVRHCFLTNDYSYTLGLTKLQEALKNIGTLEDIQRCFNLDVCVEKIAHQLLHYVVSPEDIFVYTLKFASGYITTELYKKFRHQLSERRAYLLHWHDVVGRAASFHGWLFETLAHEVLLQGGTFRCTVLDDSTVAQKELQILQITPSLEQNKRFNNDVTLEMIFDDVVYHIPKSQAFTSINSLYRSNGRLILFQMAESYHHEVNPSGLIELFIKLKCLEEVKKDPTSVYLVFVVPPGTGKSFKRQNIKPGLTYNGNWMKDAVTIIRGIAECTRKELSQSQIRTCENLWETRSRGVFPAQVPLFEKFKDNVEKVHDVSFLDAIPQHVLEIDVYNDAKS